MPTFDWTSSSCSCWPDPLSCRVDRVDQSSHRKDAELPTLGSFVRVDRIVDPGDRPHLGKVFAAVVYDPRTLFVGGLSGEGFVMVHPDALSVLEAVSDRG